MQTVRSRRSSGPSTWPWLLTLTFVLAASGVRAQTTLWDQPVSVSERNITAQVVPDATEYSSTAWDDFTAASPWLVTKVTVFGIDDGIDDGGAGYNTAVTLGIQTGSSWTTYSGTQSGNDLVFDLPGVAVASGTHNLRAWVERPLSSGYQWYWYTSDTHNGSGFQWQNPGGGFGRGPNPVSSTVLFGEPLDLAFKIEGSQANETPEPGVLLSLLPGLAILRHYRRRKAAL